jgi:hypothetical protein
MVNTFWVSSIEVQRLIEIFELDKTAKMIVLNGVYRISGCMEVMLNVLVVLKPLTYKP